MLLIHEHLDCFTYAMTFNIRSNMCDNICVISLTNITTLSYTFFTTKSMTTFWYLYEKTTKKNKLVNQSQEDNNKKNEYQYRTTASRLQNGNTNDLEENAIGNNTIEIKRNEVKEVTNNNNNNSRSSRSSNASNSACELDHPSDTERLQKTPMTRRKTGYQHITRA